MPDSGEFLSSFDRAWSDFSGSWKKARAKTTVKSVHVLRVSTRRLIATLELMRAMSRHDEIPELQRRFKRVFNGMGPLRDLQVQAQIIADLQPAGPTADFQKSLQRREARRVAAVREDLKQSTKRRLSRGVKTVRAEFVRLYERSGFERIRTGVDKVLKVRRNEFMRTRKRFKAADEDTLHAMRIALKKLRYVVEAAQPVLGESAKGRARQMHAFQQLLGDTRDLELLRTRLEKWSSKRGNTLAVVPALETLAERRQGLMQKIVESAAALDQLFPEDYVKPAVEKTLAARAGTKELQKVGR